MSEVKSSTLYFCRNFIYLVWRSFENFLLVFNLTSRVPPRFPGSSILAHHHRYARHQSGRRSSYRRLSMTPIKFIRSDSSGSIGYLPSCSQGTYPIAHFQYFGSSMMCKLQSLQLRCKCFDRQPCQHILHPSADRR
jgi:hypothetical protein